MKKFLGYFALISIILGTAMSVDMVAFNGEVFLNKLFGVHVSDSSYTEYVRPEIETIGFDDNPYEKELKNETVELSEKDSGVPEYIEPEVEEDEELAKLDGQRGYEYYFSQLDEDEKKIYRVIYKAFSEIGSGNVMPTSNEEKIEKVIFCVKNDHPEFYYAKELGYVHYTLHDQIQSTTLAVTYSDSKAGIELQKKSIDAEADRMLSGLNPNASDYEKVKYVFDTIIKETDYELNSENNQDISSVFLNHKSVCAGYARSMQYLLNRIGIPTTFVEGVTNDGSNHAWNMCLVDGQYYFVDATWGDSSYTSSKLTSKEKIEHINYDYLLVTTEELGRTHTNTSSVGFPVCDAVDNNYYVKEGLFFNDYDEAKLQAIFDDAYATGKDSVTVKCDSLALYDIFEDELIRNEGIFKYLQGRVESLSYMTDEDQRTLCFWL